MNSECSIKMIQIQGDHDHLFDSFDVAETTGQNKKNPNWDSE